MTRSPIQDVCMLKIRVLLHSKRLAQLTEKRVERQVYLMFRKQITESVLQGELV